MKQMIYPMFEYLTSTPYNFWGWLLLFSAPLLVLPISPDKPLSWRLSRLLLAIGLTYILINLTLHTHRQIQWTTYQECQSQFPDGAIQHHKECGEINIADGASALFYAFLGWIPATAYVGLWEVIWRIIHRKYIKQQSQNYKGRWLSNMVIAISIPVWIFVGFIVLLLLRFTFSNDL